jgi:hypothetical protein
MDRTKTAGNRNSPRLSPFITRGRPPRRGWRRRPYLDWVEDRTLLSTFAVSNTADAGPGSLRQAILDSNAATSGTNVIDFAIPGAGVQIIAPFSPLPPITMSVLIDGASQPGYSGTPLIELSGSQSGGGDGLLITASDVAVGGLDINGFNQGAGIHITGTSATGDQIFSSFIGTDPTGTLAVPNLNGIQIDSASNNVVGGTATSTGDVISGNALDGVLITGFGTTGNLVEGNLIGTDVTGTTAFDHNSNPLGNGYEGIEIGSGASGNTIGGSTPGAGNIISGNKNYGVEIRDTGTIGNVVEGNDIGTDLTGTRVTDSAGNSLGSEFYGVLIDSGASANTIGGTTAGARNIVSGNANDGVVLNGSGTSGNAIEGDYIGTDVTGTAALGNGRVTGSDGAGVLIDFGATDDTIGGTTAGAGNLVSANTNYGVWVFGSGTSDNVMMGNYVGTDAVGTTAFGQNGNPLGNGREGVFISGGASDNTIGGTTAGARNLISGNTDDGVEIDGSGTRDNVVEGNYVGTDATGTTAFDQNGNPMGNGYEGIEIDSGARDNTIGGATAGAGNLISGNKNYGVEIRDSGTSGNVVEGDYIGTDVAGRTVTDSAGNSLGSEFYGVFIDSGASANTVGGTTTAARNIVSGNANDGVVLNGSGTSGNVIEGDYIGTDVTGTLALGNGRATGGDGAGVLIDFGATDETIGGTTAGAGNLISGNTNYGVWVFGSGANNNAVEGNFIGTDVTGTTAFDQNGNPLGNGHEGVFITSGASGNTIGGTTGGARNLISGNKNYGVEIGDRGSSGNVVEGNYIGTDVTGTTAFDQSSNALGNGYDGVMIESGATHDTIGGTTAGARNLISGNTDDGVVIDGSGTSDNVIEGNYVGTDATGTTALDQDGKPLGNGYEGIEIDAGASDNTIGGTTAGTGNLISGNKYYGVELRNSGTDDNVVEGNDIGTDFTGTSVSDSAGNSLGSEFYGVLMDSGASDNTIGGTIAGARNLVSGNANDGVVLNGSGTSGNIIEGNYIGTDVTGIVALGNGAATGSDGAGILVDFGATDNTIGGTTAGAANLISGNANYGVWEYGSGTSGNVVEGNDIVGDGYAGVFINGKANGNTIVGNLITGNSVNSIVLLGGGTSGNLVGQNNGTGTGAAGATIAATIAVNNLTLNATASPGNPPVVSLAVVGNTADPHLALLSGSSSGLSTSQGLPSAAANAAAVSFGVVSESVLTYYVGIAGREAVLEMAFDLSAADALVAPGLPPLLEVSLVPAATILQVARLGDVTGSALDLIATPVTLTIDPGNLESELESAGGGTALLASFAPGASAGLGQGVGESSTEYDGAASGAAPVMQSPATTAAGQQNTPVDHLAPWAHFAAGVDDTWHELRARLSDTERANRAPGAQVNGTGSGFQRGADLVLSSIAPQADGFGPTMSSIPDTPWSRSSRLTRRSLAPAGATSSADGNNGNRSGINASNRAGFRSTLAAVDAAVDDLGASAPRSNRVVPIARPSNELSDCAQQPLLSIAAASLSLSMAWERVIAAARSRGDNSPRGRWATARPAGFTLTRSRGSLGA